MRVFVDTNVLFDILAQRKPFLESAEKLVIMQMFGDAELWCAPQSLLDVSYVLGKVRPAAELHAALGKVLERINLCATTHDDMKAACCAGWDDLEDALIGVLCKKVSADYLLTRDAKQDGFKGLGIPSLTPEEFFSLLEVERNLRYSAIEL